MANLFEAAGLALDPLESWSRGRSSWDTCVAEIRTGLHRRFRKRLAVARALHPLLLHSSGRRLIEALSDARLLPFRSLLSLVR